MDRNLRVIIVEDDPQECANLSAALDESGSVVVKGVTNSAKAALDYVKEYLPDVVILDLELHRGQGNGVEFLLELQKVGLSRPPFILVTTNNTSSITLDYVRKLGADFILSKHQADYSEQSVLDFLRMMEETILFRRISSSTTCEEESPNQKTKRILNRIITELDYVGISPKCVGYKYLTDSILLVIQGESGSISRIVAQKYRKSQPSVERAMQNAINRTWRTESIENLLTRYTARINSERGVPTITEFIYHYANRIKNEL